MPGTDRATAIAASYAEALLQLAARSGQEEQLLAELGVLGEVLEQRPELARELTSPLADRARRSAALERMFRGRLSDLLVDVLQVLNRRNRLLLLPRIRTVYRERFQRSRGYLDVWVTSAVELTPEERTRLSNLVRRRTGRQANLQLRVDPNLIGGLVVRIGDEKFDRSIANELVRLETKLLERASREIIAARARAQGERTP